MREFCSGASLGGTSLKVEVLVRVSSVEVLLRVGAVQVPRSWDGAPAISPLPHEKAPENPYIPRETPSERSGVRHGRLAARAGRGPPRRDSRSGRQVGRRAQGSHHLFFSLGFVCKLLWVAPVLVEVELFKCCRVSGLFGRISFAYCYNCA